MVVLTKYQTGVTIGLMDNREEPRSTPRDLREHGTGNNHKGFRQPQVNHHQARFDEGLNRQYLPNYNNYHQSAIRIHSRTRFKHHINGTGQHTIKVTGNDGQLARGAKQEAFQELTRASKDKANDTMFASIKVFDGKNRQAFEDVD